VRKLIILNHTPVNGVPSNIMQKRLRSNWRTDVPGKNLTTGRIKHYIRKGIYGEKALETLKKREAARRARIRHIRKLTGRIKLSAGNDPEAQPQTKSEWKNYFGDMFK
jgi:hypothetical protein